MSTDKDPAEQWDDLDDKTLLVQILMELKAIRMRLPEDTSQEQHTDTTTMYECDHCGATVKADERKDHALSQHKAPPDMMDTLFTRQ
ncbi:hypothetical protein OSG_eHP34_00085 [environmental Halophage eHP-34]|nr:hypothetical protein OSG_eHP34_00085 [environmental Halophage eHP-34]